MEPSCDTLSLISRSYVDNEILKVSDFRFYFDYITDHKAACFLRAFSFLLFGLCVGIKRQCIFWLGDSSKLGFFLGGGGTLPFGLSNFQFFSLAEIKKIAYTNNRIQMLWVRRPNRGVPSVIRMISDKGERCRKMTLFCNFVILLHHVSMVSYY